MQQAEKLRDKGSAFAKLFNSSSKLHAGFGLEKASSSSKCRRCQAREVRAMDQSTTIRSSMEQVYCPDSFEMWEPVLGQLVDSAVVTAVHLFPWQSADLMEAIFGSGTGSRDELFTANNGIFLHTKIATAFDRGFLAIVPDIHVGIDPKDPGALPREDKEERHKALEVWETSHPREYRIAVLDPTPNCMTEHIFSDKVYKDRFMLQDIKRPRRAPPAILERRPPKSEICMVGIPQRHHTTVVDMEGHVVNPEGGGQRHY